MAKLKNLHRLIEAAKNELPVEDMFLADLTAAIEKKDQLNGRVPSQSYKPSSMKCIRNMYFQVIGEEQDGNKASYQLIGMGESGSSRHDILQEYVIYMKELNMDCEYIDVADFVKEQGLDYLTIVKQQGHETKLYHKGLNLSFLCDGIIKYKGEYYILEIKTETTHKSSRRQEVEPEHYPQGTMYSISFNINKVIFLYEDRDNCGKKAYMLNVTEDMKYGMLNKIEECNEYVNKLIPPPYPKDIEKKTCSYCNYKKACRKAGK